MIITTTVVAHQHPKSSSSLHLFKLHRRPIRCGINFRIFTFIYKTLITGQPDYLDKLRNAYQPVHYLYSQDKPPSG